jgi:hypothetical protein
MWIPSSNVWGPLGSMSVRRDGQGVACSPPHTCPTFGGLWGLRVYDGMDRGEHAFSPANFQRSINSGGREFYRTFVRLRFTATADLLQFPNSVGVLWQPTITITIITSKLDSYWFSLFLFPPDCLPATYMPRVKR